MIKENLAYIKQEIIQSAIISKRDLESIKLIAVSKNHSADAVLEALEAGQIEFGENRAQELRDKYEIIGDKVKWHFIGVLQKNKAKYAVKYASLIHSVDSLELAVEINKQAEKIEKVQEILLEFKTSSEESKSGIATYDELKDACEKVKELKNLSLKGLMTIAPFVDDKEVIRKSFANLRESLEKLNESGFGLTELSMGMSDDFDIAIAEGATMIRIGTAIFGNRDYNIHWKEQL